MWWPLRRRRGRGTRVVFVGLHGESPPWDAEDAGALRVAWAALGDLADVAVLPGEAVPGEAVPGEAVPVEAVPVEAVPVEAVPVEAVPVEPVAPATNPSVWLGFSDGTRLVLDDDSAAANALRGVADRLVRVDGAAPSRVSGAAESIASG